jgi:prephenate dehydrogenase
MSDGAGAPDHSAAVVGYGRFGRALAGLMMDAGLRLRAWDPHVLVPPDLAAADAGALLEGTDVVVLAPPVGEIRAAIESLLPHLTPDHLVIDVGSVKMAPISVMAELLGDRIPWAATHPLFGSSSIALGERPLRAVVCPNDLHPDAASRARELYERIGCEVISQTGEEHDVLMARTHAMAFFLAKGLLDIGAGDRLPFSPPSFRALAQTIETVRSDASHLFLAIERDNPFAADARRDLLDALSRVHAELEELPVDDEDAADAAVFAIPDLGLQAPELRETRDLIDDLDAEIVRLLERRTQLAVRAGRIKSDRGRGVRDPRREHDLLEQRRAWALEHGLPEEQVAEIFSAILRFSRAAQSG